MLEKVWEFIKKYWLQILGLIGIAIIAEKVLEKKGSDAPEIIELRLQNAADEMAQAREFDYVIINELFETALFDLKAIVHAQRLKYLAQRRARAEIFQALNIT